MTNFQVPWWVPGMRGHFEEMTPIFKNTEIGIDDIGDHMREYAEKENLMTRPRRALIGSYFGSKIMLATPLIKWFSFFFQMNNFNLI
jgi:hypothetical protein